MQRREAERLVQKAREWAAKGLIPEASVPRIEDEYREALDQEPEASVAAQALYGVGGALLGAAAIALVVLLEPGEDVAGWALFGLALALGAFGVGLALLTRQQDLADALFTGALVAAVFAGLLVLDLFGGAPDGQAITTLTALGSLALVWARGDRGLVPGVATAAFFVASGMALSLLLDQEDAWSTAWLLVGLVYTASVAVLGRRLGRRWRAPVLGLCTFGVGAAVLVFTGTVLDPRLKGAYELVLGAVQLALLGAGLALREKGLVVGAALIVAIDAIVFAFDVGGLALGLSVLLATAALVLWQARGLRRYLVD